ncbi:MAG: hypothetical protein AAFU41_11660 [Pseudomonadota bacterium]
MFELGRIEATREHLFADTLETSIAFGAEETISLTDSIGLLNSSPKSQDELLNAEDEDLDDNDFPDDLGEPEISGRLQGYAENAFRHMEYRSAILGDAYPFEIKAEVLSLRPVLSASHKLYLLLLACARTRSFRSTKGMTQRIADCFEEISAECLRVMISPHGKVYMFGPSSDDRKNIFGSALATALPVLARKMGMDMAPRWAAPAGASGDGKIDIIGVYDFGDTAQGYKVVVGQCASMEDEKNWQKKRQEADLATKTGTFHFLVCPTPTLFFPSFYRSSNGDWINPDMVSGVIPIDRYRILKTISHIGEGFEVDPYFEKLGLQLTA